MDLWTVLLCFCVLSLFGLHVDMPGREEQRVNIRFLAQSGKTPIQVW